MPSSRVYVERREFPVVDVLEATHKFAQPHLLVTGEESVSAVPFHGKADPGTSTVVTPFAATSER